MSVRQKPMKESGQRRGSGSKDRFVALRHLLEVERQQVRTELESMTRALREVGRPEVGDESDRAAYGFTQELSSAGVDRLAQTLSRIEDALARHAEGRYGYCARCEEEIPIARLRSLPFADYCTRCQEEVERTTSGSGEIGLVA